MFFINKMLNEAYYGKNNNLLEIEENVMMVKKLVLKDQNPNNSKYLRNIEKILCIEKYSIYRKKNDHSITMIEWSYMLFSFECIHNICHEFFIFYKFFIFSSDNRNFFPRII